MKYDILKTALKNKCIYVLTLNNPRKRNPLSLELITILQKEFNYATIRLRKFFIHEPL